MCGLTSEKILQRRQLVLKGCKLEKASLGEKNGTQKKKKMHIEIATSLKWTAINLCTQHIPTRQQGCTFDVFTQLVGSTVIVTQIH